MPRVRSRQQEAVRGKTHVGLGNFITANLFTAAGRANLDVFAAITARVTEWDCAVSGTITNDGPELETTTTFSGSCVITMPTITDETEMAYGMEDYPCRLAFNAGENTGWDVSTALTMIGDGITQQPFAPATLSQEGATTESPTLTALDVVNGIGTATLVMSVGASSTASTPGDSSPTYPRAYRAAFILRTDPNAAGAVDPVEVGTVTFRVPAWFRGGGNNDITVPLYADYNDAIQTWLVVGNNGGGGTDYLAGNLGGSLNIVMTPSTCFSYDGAWNNDGTLAIPLDELLRWLP